MVQTAMAIMPKKRQQRNGVPNLSREKMMDTTLGDFKKRLKSLLDLIDSEDEQMPVRMMIEQRYRENSISCWTGEAFIRFTIDKDRRF